MDAEDLSKAALTAIDDWLDEEIVGFEPEEGQPSTSARSRSVRLSPLGYSPMLEPRLPTLASLLLLETDTEADIVKSISLGIRCKGSGNSKVFVRTSP